MTEHEPEVPTSRERSLIQRIESLEANVRDHEKAIGELQEAVDNLKYSVYGPTANDE